MIWLFWVNVAQESAAAFHGALGRSHDTFNLHLVIRQGFPTLQGLSRSKDEGTNSHVPGTCD